MAVPTPAPAEPTEVAETLSAKDWANLPEADFAASIGLSKSAEEAPEAPAKEEEEGPEVVEVLKAAAKTGEKAEAIVEEVAKEEEEKEVMPTEEPRLLTKFTIKDKEGELEVPQLFFDFTASKKEFKDVPLDKVVLLAQMGVRNQEREEEVKAAKEFVPQLQQQVQDLTGALQQLELQSQRLLEDEEYFLRARDIYAQNNTPEMRARRAEERLQMQQQQFATNQEEAAASNFIATQIAPTMESLLKDNPLVSERELLGEYTQLIAPILERGRVPPARLPLVKQMVDGELVHRISALQTEKALDRRQATAVEKAAIDKAKLDTAKAKRVAARAVAPRGAPGPEAKKPTSFATVDDWLKSGFGGLVPPPSTDD